MRSRMLMAALVATVAAMMAALFGAAPAVAAAYAKGVYAPSAVGGLVEGWADINTDCEGTFGCYTYIKIEYLEGNGLHPVWYDGWSEIAGRWANAGWNGITVPYQGCGNYRVTVDTYNDAPSEGVVGVSLGGVEVGLGGGVHRYHMTSTSSSSRICLTA